jgi:hypothetical protein
MARPFHLPPSASSLSASLRDLGYSLEAAIADLIDNSISAEATEIQIFCNLASEIPCLAILDNGRGMDSDEVIAAMKHGSKDPKEERSLRDLGRFGLGLKTASFSQCRQLTVISSQNGKLVGAEWDLKKIEDEDEWTVSILEEDDFPHQPFLDQLAGTGTIIIWRDLDRLLEDQTGQKRDEIVNEKLAITERHLSLVFHRFMAGEVKGRKKISISQNGHKLQPFDPFCRRNTATQMLPDETVWINDIPVVMQPYILPHHSRLSATEYDYYQSRSDFISNQGAYVYRNGRLMAWGDWFRLVPKGEATKLARVQIDFPNSLDEAWTIDIKKSRARPPHAVRERLGQIVAKITGRSVTVHRGRGQRLFQETQAPLWERYSDHGGIRYAVNLEHPMITALSSRLGNEDTGSLNLLIDSLVASLPVEMIYSDYSTNPREVSQAAPGDGETIERLKALREALYGQAGGDPESFMQIVKSTRLFENQMDTTRTYIEENFA